MSNTIDKPIVTVSGKKTLFKSDLHQRIVQDLPQDGVEWRRRLESNVKSVYIDVDFVDFDVDSVERASEELQRLSLGSPAFQQSQDGISKAAHDIDDSEQPEHHSSSQRNPGQESDPTSDDNSQKFLRDNKILEEPEPIAYPEKSKKAELQRINDSSGFFNYKLLGRPILHTYWADKNDFEHEGNKSQFDEWIGHVQASSCTEWAIIIIEDGDFKTQIGSALFKSKLQSSASQANISSSSISSTTQVSSSSFLDRFKKGLSTIFQSDSNSDRWLTLINQDRLPDTKAQESYSNFLKKFRNLVMASFSKQIELFEEQLRVQREMRNNKEWSFAVYFSMQEELAFAFEFLTMFDEALLQYDLLDALYTEYIFSPNFDRTSEPLHENWMSLNTWPGLCLDMNCDHSVQLRKRIVDKKASLLDMRNYLFAKQCDLMLVQNQPWRVAASTTIFLNNCLRELQSLNIDIYPGALSCWCFVSALEVLQKCECYSCTSTMENYSFHTVDIWNCARMKLIELGNITHFRPSLKRLDDGTVDADKLVKGLGPDPHHGVSYQKNEISPGARLRDALQDEDQYSRHLIDISELTLGTFKHIGRKRHALLVGKELAEFYISKEQHSKALPFLNDLEKTLTEEKWDDLLLNVRGMISKCNQVSGQSQPSQDADVRSE